ncbi:MAG: methyl-accepting chemotaxis protein, partial [Plesiomonas shigelloides]
MRLSLKARLLICSLAAVIITALSLSLISNKTVTDDALNNAYIEVNRLGKTYSQSVTDWIADRQNALSALKYHLEKTPPADMVPTLLQTHQAANFSLTYYGTADGKMYRQDPSLNRAGYDPRERPWYKSAISAGQLTTTAPYISATQQVMVVTMAEPVKENGQIIGVVGADLSLQQLVDEVINMDVPGNGYAILVSNDGSIVAHPQKEMWQKNINAISSVFTPDYIHQLDSTHALTTLMLGDDEKLIYATPIKKTDWSMIYIMDKDAILAHANNLILLQSAIALGILIVFSIFLVIFFRSQFKDLERVATALNDISEGEGDLTVRINTQHPHDEIGVLAAGFNRFTERLHAMVSRLSQISDELTNQSSAAFNIANSNNVAISTQQDEITMVATAVTEMASATQEIANHAEETAHTSQNAVSLCQQGQTQVQQSQSSIRDLAAEVASASQII